MTPSAGYPLLSVVHLIRPIGVRAGTLAEPHAAVAEAEPRTLFYHTRPRAAAPSSRRRSRARRLQRLDQRRAPRSRDRRAAYRSPCNRPTSAESCAPPCSRCWRDSRIARVDARARGRRAGVPHARIGHDPDGRPTVDRPRAGARPGRRRRQCVVLPPDRAAVVPGRPTIFEWTESIGEPRLAQWLVEDASSGLPLGTLRRRLLALAAEPPQPPRERRPLWRPRTSGAKPDTTPWRASSAASPAPGATHDPRGRPESRPLAGRGLPFAWSATARCGVLEGLARRLAGHRVVMVNSTATGGGVAGDPAPAGAAAERAGHPHDVGSDAGRRALLRHHQDRSTTACTAGRPR